MDFKKEISELVPQMIALRRDFHAHPELGLNEFRTADIIENYLKDLGIETRRCTPTGVVGVLKGGQPGKTVLLRCDIDALPVTEETGLPFASQNPGVMHACGHDGHASIHLTTAKLLANHRDEIKGTVVFVFQTNEEEAGAELMIKAGAMDDKPDAAFGFHLWSPNKTGQIAVVPGPIMASSYYFKIIIKGLGGHGGAPHKAINPIDCAAHVLDAIKTYHTLELPATEPTVISVCKLHAGDKEIVVPETLEMEGSIRCLNTNDKEVRERFAEICKQVCAAYRCTCEVSFVCGNILLNNDEAMTDLVMEAAAETVGKENIVTRNVSVMLGDDFAEFSARVPGCYYFVGTASEKAESTYEHHTPRFRIDEDSLAIAVEMEARTALKYLNM